MAFINITTIIMVINFDFTSYYCYFTIIMKVVIKSTIIGYCFNFDLFHKHFIFLDYPFHFTITSIITIIKINSYYFINLI